MCLCFDACLSVKTKMEAATEGLLSQDEILSRTKLIMQGLDSLKADHVQLINANSHLSGGKTSDDRAVMLKKSLERIDLGVNEAQVDCSNNCTVYLGN